MSFSLLFKHFSVFFLKNLKDAVSAFDLLGHHLVKQASDRLEYIIQVGRHLKVGRRQAVT